MSLPANANHFPNRGFQPGLHLTEHIAFILKVPDELTSLDANAGLGVESTYDAGDVEPVHFGELARTEPVVAVGAGSVMAMTQRDR
jgi:hypothetical protein